MAKFSLKRLVDSEFFSESEAWNIFRLAAFGEAIGWTLLISGITISKYLTPGNNDAVQIAGQIHGTLFIAYIAAVLATAGSLRWSLQRTVVAGLLSVPPYGTLVYEIVSAHIRKRQYREIRVSIIVPKGSKLLAIQPNDKNYWTLPGGKVRATETMHDALQRVISEQFSIVPSVKELVYIYESSGPAHDKIEFVFSLSNDREFSSVDQEKQSGIEQCSYITLKKQLSFEPKSLQKRLVANDIHKTSLPIYISDNTN